MDVPDREPGIPDSSPDSIHGRPGLLKHVAFSVPLHSNKTTLETCIKHIWKDSLYTDSVQLTDLDLATILGDEFTYAISWGNALLPTSSIINEDVVVDTNGLISWTPVATDTGKYRIKVLVTDMWGLKDSLVYPITIKAVNDRPVFSQSLPDTFFVEDQTD